MSETPVEGTKPPPAEAMTFAEFLQAKPPGTMVKISDLMTEIKYQGGGRLWQVSVPPLQLHCEECGGLRYFPFKDGNRHIKDGEGDLSTFLTYVCSNCRITLKMYSIYLRAEPVQPEGECYKHGEMPPFGPITPPRLLKMFEHNRDLFMKGRRCESQGLGIGAFVYYRRVVEDQRVSIIGEIIRVARLIKAPPKTLASLEAAQKETQFSKSLDLIKDAMPESLQIQGHKSKNQS